MPGDETPEVEETETAGTEQAEASAPAGDEAPEAPEVVEPEIVEPPSPEQLALAAAEEKLAAERKRREDTEGRLRAVSKAYTDLQKEMEEFKKRLEARANLQVQNKAAEIVRTFFEPIQNLKRAAEAGGDAETLQQGLTMVSRQFHDTMAHLGLAELPGVGAPFDPELHEALALAPVEDPSQDGMILMVHRSGYQLNGQVIQPAQVVIGKHEAPAAEA
ncbi:MAG: nucleotide exchange factor GrpE [Deltaproteobacteria bacterium]|nr:MAG: nucleotide exchange factor GrpE [Deltaproteobacteria bacterium]